MKSKNHPTVFKLALIAVLSLLLMAFVWLYKDNNMMKNKVVEWGSQLSGASYTLYKKDNLYNRVSLQKSDKVRSYSTSFYLDDGIWLRTLDGGTGIWGYGARPLGGDEFEQPLPEKVIVTYLDTVENQYYQGEHSLPTDKIYALMTSRHRKMADSNPWTRETGEVNKNYSDIELAFAPKGWVIVFVTGWAGRVEVESFQATPIEPDPATYEGEKISSGDESLVIDYEYYLKNKDISNNEYLEELREKSPDAYEKWISGALPISSDWYKKLQTKYPWNLSVSIDGQDWNGEYYSELVNTEKFEVLNDHADSYQQALKAVPQKFKIWATDQSTGERTELEVHLYPRPKWAAKALRSKAYQPYYQDPNLNRFFTTFEKLYPNRSLATNEQPAKLNEFSTLKLHFNKDLILQDAYLIKSDLKVSLDGAYQLSRAPIDPEYSEYIAQQDYPKFITEPKLEDLSDPAFVDID